MKKPSLKVSNFALAWVGLLALPLFVVAAVEPLHPRELRGVFWKQEKVTDADGTHDNGQSPGDFGIQRTLLFDKLRQSGVNAVVVDINAEDTNTAPAEVAAFVVDLYNWDTNCPIRIYFHQRRYFNGHVDPGDDAEVEESAGDFIEHLAAIQALKPEAAQLIDGIRWGENGDGTMQRHLKTAWRLAQKINLLSGTNWLKNKSFIINGQEFGAYFNGIQAAATNLDFAAKIQAEVKYFALAYKHMVSGGMMDAFDQWRTNFVPAKPDAVATWEEFIGGEFALAEAFAWATNQPAALGNVIFIGDSGDATRKTSDNAFAAIKNLFRTSRQKGFLFTIPFGHINFPYYEGETCLYMIQNTNTAQPDFGSETQGKRDWTSYLTNLPPIGNVVLGPIEKLPDGQVRFLVTAEPRLYTVEAATPLGSGWTNIGTADVMSGSGYFTDPQAPNFAQRFYRTLSQ
jgi:hypothetical protein